MQFSTPRSNTPPSTLLGERRGKPDLARFSLDLNWGRVASDCARSRAYPSPPMSGSPPLPPSRNPDSSDRGHGGYGPSGQDVFQGIQTPQPDRPDRRAPPLRPYQPDVQPPAFPPYRMEEHHPPLLPPYQQQPPPAQQLMQQHPHPHPYRQQPSQAPTPFAMPERPSTGEGSDFSSSPKAQRKTKGHVASACVPCKRAHLRCDSQRPCSRCMANGKEDSCIDVQHKKRGRPRLRDEREERYEGMGSGYSHAPESGMRRPLPLYSASEAAMGSGFGDTLQRSGSYRVLKSQGGQAASRYLDHAPPTDTNMFGGHIVPAPLVLPSQEPLCAYLTMEMQIAKVAQSFTEAVGMSGLVTKKLQDLVPGDDREKLARLQRIFEDERRQREPNYLPPIYNFQEDRVIQSVGFGPDEVGHVRLDHPENLTFQSPDGQQRALQGRFGLSKKDSTYFIVLMLHPPTTRPPYSQPSLPAYQAYPREPYPREPQYAYQAPQQPYPQIQQPPSFMGNPGLADPRGDTMAYRQPGPSGSSIHPPASMPPFSQPHMRSDYSHNQNPYETPRSELPSGQARQHDLQLPPIRDQRGEGPSTEPARRRDDRSSRVDIGGLLETPRSAGGR